MSSTFHVHRTFHGLSGTIIVPRTSLHVRPDSVTSAADLSVLHVTDTDRRTCR